MMSDSKLVSSQTVHVYQSVIDDVISRVKPDLVAEGIDETVLDELRALWEAKLVATGVLGDPNQETAQVLAAAAPAPRPGVIQYRQAAPGMAMGQQYPGQMQQLGVTQLMHPHAAAAAAAAAQQQQQQMAALQQARYAAAGSMPTAAFAAQQQQQQQQMVQPQQQMGAAVGDKRRLEQQTGMPLGEPPLKREQLGVQQPGAVARPMGGYPHQPGLPHMGGIPQQDGTGDDGDGGAEGAADEGGEPDEELNENDDLAAVDDEEVDEEQLQDVVLGQFDKVGRTKSRWKVQLRDCIITAHGRDYLVHRATGEMNF